MYIFTINVQFEDKLRNNAIKKIETNIMLNI